MITDETLKKLKSQFNAASWAVWSENFPYEGCLELGEDPNSVYTFVKEHREELNPNVILLALNPSKGKTKNFWNFHRGSKRASSVYSDNTLANVYLLKKLIQELHHLHEDIVKGSFHLHFDEDTCYDIWVIQGKTEKILQLIEQLNAMRGTKHVGEDLVSI